MACSSSFSGKQSSGLIDGILRLDLWESSHDPGLITSLIGTFQKSTNLINIRWKAGKFGIVLTDTIKSELSQWFDYIGSSHDRCRDCTLIKSLINIIDSTI